MSKNSLVFVITVMMVVGCTSNQPTDSGNDQLREVSSTEKERTQEEADADYWERQGKEWSKFKYDGYTGMKNKFKFAGAIGSPENVKFALELSGRRTGLLEENLFDTGVSPNAEIDCASIMKRVHRTSYGECYFHGNEEDLRDRDKNLVNQLRMGAVNERFGRNIDKDKISDALKKDMMNPSPLEVSEKLLARNGEQIDAPVINVLATAWLQAMNHDWFTHGKNSKTKKYRLKGHKSHGEFAGGIDVPATQGEKVSEKGLDKKGYRYVSRNRVTHWWDASQIYGSDPETIRKVRSEYDSEGNPTGNLLADGKIAVDQENRRLIYDQNNLPITGFHDNWWVGLELIHVLFHLEHNSIVDNILKPLIGKEICVSKEADVSREECGEELFEKARMINAALIAKIHTAEWTPALLDHEMLHLGMRSNWYGFREFFGGDSPYLRGKIDGGIRHLVSGLVGENTLDLYAIPFTLTEEFVAVYRMHPLIPDFVTVRDGETNEEKQKVSTREMIFRKTRDTFANEGALTWLNSFGTSFPGAMTLHNYPTWMKNFVAERNTGTKHSDATRMDMGAIDIFRDRERGIPRYNEFRRALKLPAIETFEQLTKNPKDVETLKEVYNNDIEAVDLLIGTLAEADRYPGFAFGNTPFYIFALMASRRLMADPFFSDYYTAEYYTKAGIDHIQKDGMIDVITRHYPELHDRFYKRRDNGVARFFFGEHEMVVKNAFRPWLPVYNGVKEAIKDMDSL